MEDRWYWSELLNGEVKFREKTKKESGFGYTYLFIGSKYWEELRIDANNDEEFMKKLGIEEGK